MKLTVLYDEQCALCRRARDWLLIQPMRVEMELLAAGSPVARARYGSIPWVGQELIVVSDDGRVWRDGPAFLVCLWATRRYRSFASRMSAGAFKPMAVAFFNTISKRRGQISALLDDECDMCVG
jgi:predicted DCC family thiol-disulfide oxidoreductase YuxK